MITNTGPTAQMHAQLAQLFRDAKLPTSPALALQILALSKEPDASINDYCRLLKTDPALSGRLLQSANAAETGQVRVVATIERAVALLGLRRVKSLALGFQLVAHLDRLGGVSFNMMRFWQHSLLRACMARAIAEECAPTVVEESFLVGMLQDCGIPLLVQILGAEYSGIIESDPLSPASLFQTEQRMFPYTHVDAATALLADWGLPDEIVGPIALHHELPMPADPENDIAKLHVIGYVVGNLCFDATQRRCATDAKLADVAGRVFGFNAEQWEKIQHCAVDTYRRDVVIYSGKTAHGIDVVELLSEANRQLSHVADEVEERLRTMQAEQERIVGTHQRVAKSLREYRERAALDPLTGLSNRGALAASVRSMMEHPHERPTEFCVAFLDLDDFKNINDEFGHQAGDEALKAVAAALIREAGYGGTVARFGGEEFLLVYVNVSVDTAREIGDRILQRIRAIDFLDWGFPRPVTCSVGVAWTDLVSTRSAEDLIAHADDLMYQAKRAGKNQVCCKAYWTAEMAPELVQQLAATNETESSAECDLATDGDALLDELVAVAAETTNCNYSEIVGLRKEIRDSVFMPCRLELLSHIDADVCLEIGVIRDFSTGGAGIVTTRPLVRGEPVHLTFANQGDSRALQAMVSFSRALHGRFHHIGLQFVPTDSKALSSTAETADAAALSEHR